jgi:quercetin dioxygenase-like cupin family protein
MKTTASVDIPEHPVDDPAAKDVFMRMLVGPADGAPNFFLRRFRICPGGHTPRHQHPWEHEVFVLSGEGEACSDQGGRLIAAGSVVFIPAGEIHQFKNTGHTDLEFLCIVPASSAR